MVANKKITGRATSLPAGLAIGATCSLAATLILTALLARRGEVRSFVAQQNTLVVHMAGMSLAEVSAMLESVQRQPIVAGASLNLASTADEAGLLEFSVTIVLQSAGEGEG